jgi:hypothetical protein
MTRPCSTAPTRVAKLSSVMTIAAASLATSVPLIPIATPMSACFSAGASLTPSPVMAATSPPAWNASTIRSVCSGETRANTPTSADLRGRRLPVAGDHDGVNAGPPARLAAAGRRRA